MKKTIITVVGKDSVGIIAKVCTYLSEKRSIVSSAYSERKFLTKCTASKEDKNCD
mgnify:CR=1 FL=1